MIKHIFFDVAGTLMHKPSVYTSIQQVLFEHGYKIPIKEIKFKHKMLLEATECPDRTNKQFYETFNKELLYLLGVLPENDLPLKIFDLCTYLPWEPFSDTDCLQHIKTPMSIISNFNNTLKQKLDNIFGEIFSAVFISEELGLRKPSSEFYKKVLQDSNLQSEQVLYVGDSVKLDIEPARMLGMNVLLIDRERNFPHCKLAIQDLSEIKKLL